jgi:hypothetical protein
MRWSAKEEGAVEVRRDVLYPAEVRRDMLCPVPEQVAGLAMAASRVWPLTASVQRRRQGRTR